MLKLDEILGADATLLLQHHCKTIPKENLLLPGPDYVDRAYGLSDRPTPVLKKLRPAEFWGLVPFVTRS